MSVYPTDGEVFELTLDGDAPENDPIEMVRRNGFDNFEDWKYTGKRVTGKQTHCFKLVRVGYCRNLDEIQQKLTVSGEVPEGQWREAFKAAYPNTDESGPIGFADPSWVYPLGHARFPCVSAGGYSYFRWTADGFDRDWRWLVGVSE